MHRETNLHDRPRALIPAGGPRAQTRASGALCRRETEVKEGRMPKPKHEGSRRIWDRFGLDLAFEKLPSADEVNPWDEDR